MAINNRMVKASDIKIGEKFQHEGKTYTRAEVFGHELLTDLAENVYVGATRTEKEITFIDKSTMVETINRVFMSHDDKLYCIPCSDGGFSCLGIEVAIERAKKYVAWLMKHEDTQIPEIDLSLKGTVDGYLNYRDILNRVQHVCTVKHIRCDAELSPQLIGLEGKRVEVVTTYDETRRFIVGKSTGQIPIHLEVKRRDSSGGGAAESKYKSVRVV
jgi:hypothetical protein